MGIILEGREDVPQNTILGRKTAGTGDWEELTPKDLASILFAYEAQTSGQKLSAAVNSAAPTATVGAIPLNVLRAYQWDFKYPTFVRIISACISTAGAAGTQARVAIYNNGGLVPGTKIADTELLLDGTVTTEQSLTFPSTELYGRYWVVYNGSAALAARTIPVTGMKEFELGPGLGNNSQRTCIQIASPFASGLPTTFPTVGTNFTLNTPGLLVALQVT